MLKYTAKRLLYSVLILFFVMFIIYVLMYNMPMGFVEQKARELASRPGATKSYAEWLADLNAQYGMDRGVVGGYFVWLSHAVRGQWGDSWAWTIPVTQEFHNTVWFSFALGLVCFIFEILIAIPLGIAAAKKQYSFTDYFTTVFAMVCISLPTFFLATLLKYFFSVKLGWFDLSGMQGRDYVNLDKIGRILDVAKHFVLPAITLIIISIGGLMRYTRTNMQPSRPVLRRADHRDPVLDPRHRLRVLHLHDPGRYPLYHVLSGLYLHPDAAGQPDHRPSVRRGRSPRQAELGGAVCLKPI